jgi:hypothetical protein
MAIIHDYDGIAAELHRIRAERARYKTRVQMELELEHRMQATIAGDRLYRRLLSQQYWRSGRRSRD